MEVLGLLRRALTQQVEVRAVVYQRLGRLQHVRELRAPVAALLAAQLSR